MTAAIHRPFVTVAIPVLDEEAYLAACLRSLVEQWPEEQLEMLVLDGGSSDASVEIATALREEHPCIRVVRNPGRRQAAACNLAAEVADDRATILLRADAHAEYPPHFVGRCVEALQRTGATSVVVPMRTVGSGRLQRAVATAQNSLLGNGGSPHRSGGRSGWVDHGHHAAFDRAFFRRIGGYDTSFAANEDVEHDLRALAAGGRIWMCVDAEIVYFPRSTFRGLALQYFRYGVGRAATMRKHRYRPKLRHLGSVGILASTVGGAAGSFRLPIAGLLPLGYLGLCTASGVIAAARARDPWLVLAGPAAVVMHHSWAIGFLCALWPARAVAGRPGSNAHAVTAVGA